MYIRIRNHGASIAECQTDDLDAVAAVCRLSVGVVNVKEIRERIGGCLIVLPSNLRPVIPQKLKPIILVVVCNKAVHFEDLGIVRHLTPDSTFLWVVHP